MTLTEFVKEHSDFNRPFGAQADELLRDAMAAGISTTRGSLQVCWYQTRKKARTADLSKSSVGKSREKTVLKKERAHTKRKEKTVDDSAFKTAEELLKALTSTIKRLHATNISLEKRLAVIAQAIGTSS